MKFVHLWDKAAVVHLWDKAAVVHLWDKAAVDMMIKSRKKYA